MKFLLFILIATASYGATDFSYVVKNIKGGNGRDAHFVWRFESSSGLEVRSGTFAGGETWIAPAVGDTAVRLVSLTGSGRDGETDWIALDDDPKPNAHGLLPYGFDIWGAAGTPPSDRSPDGESGQQYRSNDSSQNDIGNLPLLYTAEQGSCISLVASMQRNEPETSLSGTKQTNGAQVDAYCIVTVLPEPPPNNGSDMIRPNIVGDSKEFLTWSDFDLSRLPSFEWLGERDPVELEALASNWRHSTEVFAMGVKYGEDDYSSSSEGGRAFRPMILHSDYGAFQANEQNEALLELFGTNSFAEKSKLLAVLLSRGLDNWNHVYGSTDEGYWGSGAGQSAGQSTISYFATALLVDPEKREAMRKTAALTHSNSHSRFKAGGEIRQVMRGVTGVLLWGDGHQAVEEVDTVVTEAKTRYWGELLAGKNFTGATGSGSNNGQKTARDPHRYIDGPGYLPGENYMSTMSGPTLFLGALMIMIPEVRYAVGTDGPIEYGDRLYRVGVWTYPDPVAPPTNVDFSGCNTYLNQGAPAGGCLEWREQWGPLKDDARRAHENGIGRFTYYHGTPIWDTNQGLIRTNWEDHIWPMFGGYNYEARFTPLGECVPADIFQYKEAGQDLAVLWSPTLDSDIRYTLDGSEPDENSSLYSGSPVTIPSGSTIKAKVYANALIDSKVSSWSGLGGYVIHGVSASLPEPPSPADNFPKAFDGYLNPRTLF